MESVSLERVPLSARTRNVLHYMGLSTVEDLMNTPIEEIAAQHYVGVKTIQEVERIRGEIARGELSFFEEPSESEKCSYAESDLREMSRYSIEELGLSNHSYFNLIRSGLSRMDQLVTFPAKELWRIRNIGKKSQAKIEAALERWLDERGFVAEKGFDGDVEPSEEEEAYFQKIVHVLDPLVHVYWKHLWRDARDSGHWEEVIRGGWDSLRAENWNAVLRLEYLCPKLSLAMQNMLKEDLLTKTEFLDRCREYMPVLDPELLLNYGLEANLLEERMGYCLFKRAHVMEVLEERDDDSRETRMVRLRLLGRSLQEVGNLFSVTRERVRQVVRREWLSFPPLFEDYFVPILGHFQWTREEFSRLFPELGRAGVEYLFQRYGSGKKPLSEESAAEYFGVWRERLMEYLKNEEIRKDQESASRVELLVRTLKDHSDLSFTYEELEEAYYDYLARGGFPAEDLKIHRRIVANYLRTVPNVVFDREGKARYCPVRGDLIWECIDFQPYRNMVLSAERIYRDYPELMVELDIRDGYELFYVLKWSLDFRPSDLFEIRCRRVPVIVMGEASEEKQAFKLLRELSPVDYQDFYTAYEEIYGVRRVTAQGNPAISSVVTPYLIGGKYQLDAVYIDEADAVLLSEKLKKKELWWEDELERLFDRICICSPKEAFNAAAFRKIGYILNSGYLFPVEYVTAVRFFEEKYLSDNVLDLSELESRLLHLPTFHTLLVRKKKELDFIEVSPKLLFSIQRIEALYGLTKAHLSELQEWLSRRFPKYFNGYSLWENVQIHPYVQRLQGNKWMLTCIMRQKEEVISLPVAGSIILSLDKTSLCVSKICEWLVEIHGVMSLEELERTFNDTFGSRIQHESFMEKLRKMDIDWGKETVEAVEFSVVSDENSKEPVEREDERELCVASEATKFEENWNAWEAEKEVPAENKEDSASSEREEEEDIMDGGGDMGKYEPLKERLMLSGLDEIRMSFLEMEEILGFELPPSARKYPAWWANGGQVHSEVWIDAGYKVNGIDFINGEIRFVKNSAYPKPRLVVSESASEESGRMSSANNVVPIRTERDSVGSFGESAEPRSIPTAVPTELSGKKMTVEGHDFYFIQTLVPERELNGRIKRYYPQQFYENGEEAGKEAFCRFSVQAGAWSGVYLWVADGEILYIGETVNLANRFNVGYGHITSRNCYAGERSVNCRMNRVVLDYFEKGKIIALFFCPTEEHRELETELLSKRLPRFNREEVSPHSEED